MANEFVWLPNNSDDAFEVTLRSNEPKILRLKAPADAPTEPGPWIDFAGTLDGEALTSNLSSSYWIDGYTNGDPDTAQSDVDTTQGVDTTEPQAWMASYPLVADPTLNEQYYQVGLTTLSLAGLLTDASIGTGEPLPNQHGPETQGDVTGFTWHVRGGVTYQALSELDSTASQLTDVVLKYAVVPESLVQANTAFSTLQYEWKEYPTLDVLGALTLIGSRALPAWTSGDWSTVSGNREAYVDLTFDIDVPGSLVVNGQVHVAYWLERVSQADRSFDTTYSAIYSTLQDRTNWTSIPDGPLDAIFSMSDAQDPTSSYESSYSNNPTASGYWQKSGEEIWLASLGSTPGGRVGLAINKWGLLLGPRVVRWVFSQISTTDFGVAIGIQLATRVLVVTPTQVLNIEASGTTVLATHSTPFSVGDQVDVKTTYDLPTYWDPSAVATGVVYLNGVQVSTFTWPSAYTYADGFWSPTPWALTADSGNRVSTIELTTIPTNRGLVTIEVELDKTDVTPSTSTFVADVGSVVQYRWLWAIGYPRAALEPDPTRQGESVVMWVKFGVDTDMGELWYDFVNPEATGSPDLPFDEWSNIDYIASQAFMRRPDGDLYGDVDSSFFDTNNSPVKPPILYNDDPTRMIWVTDDTHDKPYGMSMVSKHVEFYRVFELGGYANGASDGWWGDVWGDVWLYLHPRGRLPAPRVWSWQPGDDHGGLQDEGYTHNPVPLGSPPGVLTDGVVLHVEDSLEDWLYAIREVYVGYTDDTGPFVYSSINPWSNQFPAFDSWGQSGYGYGAADDVGNIMAPLYYAGAWHNSRATLWAYEQADWRTSDAFPSGHQSKAGFNSNYASDVVWSRDAASGTVGQRTTAGPTTVDSFFICDANSAVHGDPMYIDVEYNVGSDFGGVFVRWRVNFAGDEMYYKVSQSQIIHVVNGVETVLDSWSSELSQRVIAEGATITVKDGSGATLSTVAAPLDYEADDLIPRYLFGLWSRRPAGDSMRIARFMATSTDFPSDWTQSVTSDETQVGWSLISGADRFGESRGRAVRGTLDWSMPTEPLSFDDPRWNGRNDLPDWKVRDILWLVWLPAYPDSVFIQLNENVWNVSTPDHTTLRFYEVNKLTGVVINELTPIYDHATGDLPDTTSAIASPDGTKIWTTTAAFSTTGNQLVEYDPATDTMTTLHTVPTYMNAQLLGILPDGRELYQNYRSQRYFIYDASDTSWLEVMFEPYEGKGFNGGLMGWDGKWCVWGGQLNYHVHPNTYKLSAAEVAGTSTPAGTIVSLGSGEAKFFSEYYRYNIQNAGQISGADLVTEPNGGSFWSASGAWGDSFLAGDPGGGWDTSVYSNSIEDESTPDDVRVIAAHTVNEIAGDTTYEFRVGYDEVSMTDASNKYLISADVSAYLIPLYARFRVQQGNTVDGLLHVDDQPIATSSLTVNWGYPVDTTIGFEQTISMEITKYPGAEWLIIQVCFHVWDLTPYGGTADDTPYARVRDLSVIEYDGAVPIEYMFNLDPEQPQTYCDVVRPDGFGGWESWSGEGIQYQFPVLAFPATFVPQAGWTIGTIGEEDPTPEVNQLILHGRGNAAAAGVTGATVTLSSPTDVGQTIVLVGYTNAGTPSGVSINGLGATWHLESQGSFIYAVGTAPTAGLTDITVSYPFASQFTVLAAAFSGAGAEKFATTGGDSGTPNTVDILKGDTTLILNKYPPGGTSRPLSGQTAVVGWYVRGGSVGTATPLFTDTGGRYKQVPMVASGNGVTVELSHGSIIGDGGTNRVGHRTDNPTVYEGVVLVFAPPDP